MLASRREAVALNQASASQLARKSGESSLDDNGLAAVERPVPANMIVTSHQNVLGDEHFAISEAAVESDRNAYRGNWIQDGHAKFREEFALVVQGDAEAVDDEELAENHCQALLCPGVCRKQLTLEFARLFDQAKDLLRWKRSERKHSGFIASHILVAVVEQGTSCIKQIHLLARVSFSPFDATAIEFDMVDEKRARLSLVNLHGHRTAKLKPLPLLLMQISRDRPVLELKTCNYRAVSLAEIELTGGLLRPSEIGVYDQQAAEECDSDDGQDKELSAKSALLRAAAGTKQKRAARARDTKPKSQASTDSISKVLSKLKQSSKKKRKKAFARQNDRDSDGSSSNAEEEGGVAANASNDILQEWQGALEAQLPVAPAKSQSSSSTSARPAEKAEVVAEQPAAPSVSAASVAVPIESFTHPWKDTKGFCWIYVAETGKPYPLGFLALTLRFAVILWCSFS